MGLPVHGAATEEFLFGSLPTLLLQDEVYPLSPAVFSWAAVVVHVSWFFVPWVIGILISWKRPQRLGSFFVWWISLHFIVNPIFALFPLQPPWMASVEVTRILDVHLGSGVPDNNPLAAMPSLHVALPLLISFWLFRERWKLPALGMLAYTALVAFEVLLSGEHYAVDVVGAAVVAGAIALAAQIDYRRVFSRLFARYGKTPELAPVFERAAPLGSDRQIAADRVQPGLTSQPGVIIAVTAALILVVSVQAALALFTA